mgnify:FL=1|jgi:hypothetical protein|tara:strand:- start:42 stop:179 length:138 start_codon:yes stop_codon:yes gene_type:complete
MKIGEVWQGPKGIGKVVILGINEDEMAPVEFVTIIDGNNEVRASA